MITVDSLTKTYGGFTAVDDVSFTCRPGRVTGFLGPNGAGKTTAMRVMVGLSPATRGRVTIGGRHYHDIPNPGRHVGVLLDASAQHDGRTGREILALGAATMGLPGTRVDEMLELVSLDRAESKRRLRNYSLGMKQRLGIAHALLGDPSVLILDEPANGLDPAGIRWMRDLLGDFARRGGTVLLSSHLLHEVEQIADELILIGRGKILAQGDKASLLNADPAAGSSHVTALDNDELARALTDAGHRVERAGPGLSVAAAPVDVGRVAAERRIVLTDLRSAGGGLEELFLELTADSQREARPSVPPRPGNRPRTHPRSPLVSSSTPSGSGPSGVTGAPPPSPADIPRLDVSGTPGVPFTRLVSVELRKIADTRAGRWLLGAIVAITAAIMVDLLLRGGPG